MRFLLSVPTRLVHVSRAALEEESSRWKLFQIILAFTFSALLFYGFFFAPPRHFPSPSLYVVERGASLSVVADQLHEARVIRSPLLFKLALYLSGEQRSVVAGSYYLTRPQGLLGIAARVATGDFKISPIKVTVPEGLTIQETANLLDLQLGIFDREGFLRAAQGKEGYLFPDTYFFLPGEDPQLVVDAFTSNFQTQIKKIQDKIDAHGEPLEDVVTMASLLEEEARTTETRRIIADILWRRIDIGMPLQVDAVFIYFLGKNTYQLSLDDLKVDSPYNTYLYKGLPVGPITNPGLSSLEAAVTPIKTKYLYYLNDAEGEMHYSVTHEGHVENKDRYLR